MPVRHIINKRRPHEKNFSTGSTNPNRAGKITQENLARLDAKIAEMKGQDKKLDVIDVVVGRPHEGRIPRDKLIPAPSEWDCFPKATEEKIREISTSIKAYGLLHNITVWKQPSGKYMILGGHTRTACYDYLYSKAETPSEKKEWGSLPALVYSEDQLSEVDAHRIFIISNTDQKELSIKTKSEAYLALMRLEKENNFYGSSITTRESTAIQAGVSESMFQMYLGLLNLIPELQKAIDELNLTVKAGYHLSRMPKDLQEYIYQSGEYLTISAQGARQIKKAQNIDEIKRILNKIDCTPKYYPYKVRLHSPKPEGTEVVPIIIEKGKKKEYLNKLVQAIDESNFEQNLKDELHKIMNTAFD